MQNSLKRIFHDFIPGFGIAAILALVYLLNLIVIVSYDVELSSAKWFVLFYGVLYVVLLVLVNLIAAIFSRFLYLTAQSFKGSGTYAQTRISLFYSCLGFLPINILIVVYKYYKESIQVFNFIYFGSIACLVFSIGLLIYNISRYHKIKKVDSFISILISFLIIALISYVLHWLKNIA